MSQVVHVFSVTDEDSNYLGIVQFRRRKLSPDSEASRHHQSTYKQNSDPSQTGVPIHTYPPQQPTKALGYLVQVDYFLVRVQNNDALRLRSRFMRSLLLFLDTVTSYPIYGNLG